MQNLYKLTETKQGHYQLSSVFFWKRIRQMEAIEISLDNEGNTEVLFTENLAKQAFDVAVSNRSCIDIAGSLYLNSEDALIRFN